MAVRRLSGSCWKGRFSCNLSGAEFQKHPGWIILGWMHLMRLPTLLQMRLHTRQHWQLRGHPFHGCRQEWTHTSGQDAYREAPGRNETCLEPQNCCKRGFFLNKNMFFLHRRLPQQLLTPLGPNLCTRWPLRARRRRCGIWCWIWK